MKTLFLLVLLVNCSLSIADEPPLVIVNPEADTREISSRNLLRIYTMQQKRWPNGKKVRVYTLPLLNKTHQSFAKRYKPLACKR